ncbi:hypothetical protein [Clostridium saccharobutylicum]|uniref:Helix-turn-helix domain protein n=1 Tax=Clostridium saccharobutylicum TaxID=169679 RepID=A0A1S8NKI1_CLOSA|nr:hypothetical protein [Clostridium saccharobutylicum]OOM16751.1 hypothetical protein CLOSAC_10450 [Clostridium saccharobutylicum]
MRKPTEDILTVDDIRAEQPKLKKTEILLAIKRKELIAEKHGRRYLVNRKALNTWLGFENNEEEYKKDLYIKELENKIKGYQIQFETFKGLLKTLANVADI